MIGPGAHSKCTSCTLVFHLGLLGIVILAAVGRLTHLDARVEMVEGTAFSPNDMIDVRRGPLHFGALDKISFVQHQYTVDYAANMTRGLTHSYLQVPDGKGGWEERVIGDDRPLIMEGYRFYTSFNKGFSPILTWIPDNGQPVTGTVNMPSYPLFEYNQSNSWTPPGSHEIKFWLQLDTGMDPASAWTLDRRHTAGVLVVNNGERRVELHPGEAVQLDGGRLRYEQLRQWMGYKIFYDPTLQWLFLCAMIGVIGLASHYWRTFSAVHTAAGKINAVTAPRDPVANKGSIA